VLSCHQGRLLSHDAATSLVMPGATSLVVADLGRLTWKRGEKGLTPQQTKKASVPERWTVGDWHLRGFAGKKAKARPTVATESPQLRDASERQVAADAQTT